jgi:hypothetical protein
MNTKTLNTAATIAPTADHARKVVPFSARARLGYSANASGRDFGMGYGNSSGYGLDKRYTSDWGQLRFRCA